jgi:ankyrin repeat protein
VIVSSERTLDVVDVPHPRFGGTPLFYLPDDEDRAVAVAELLMAHGADRTRRNKTGDTPEQAARKRGLDDAADVIRDASFKTN